MIALAMLFAYWSRSSLTLLVQLAVHASIGSSLAAKFRQTNIKETYAWTILDCHMGYALIGPAAKSTDADGAKIHGLGLSGDLRVQK